ncbi:2-oxoglutarate and iron-dependent oxygenase domain-containing protein [Amycolatopsis sp. NPDC004368]
MAGSLTAVSTVDLRAGERLSGDVDAAFTELGLLLATGHGVAPESLSRAFRAARGFFDLPKADKESFAPAPGEFLGYSGLKTVRGSTTSSSPPDLKERFAIGPGATATSTGTTDAARHHEELVAALRTCYDEMEQLAKHVLRALTVPLGVGQDYFEARTNRSASYLVAIDYPALDDDAWASDRIRASAHRDRSCLTALAVAGDEPSGLQVQLPDGTWQDVAVPANVLALNVGSMLTRWTGDRWPAPMHRVRNPHPNGSPATRRQSLAFFFNPNPDVVLAPITPSNAAQTPPADAVTVGEFLRTMLESHSRGSPV